MSVWERFERPAAATVATMGRGITVSLAHHSMAFLVEQMSGLDRHELEDSGLQWLLVAADEAAERYRQLGRQYSAAGDLWERDAKSACTAHMVGALVDEAAANLLAADLLLQLHARYCQEEQCVHLRLRLGGRSGEHA